MSLITIPFTFSAGAVIIASQHNSNFTTISSDYNGNIDNTNIATSAAIVYSKLSLTGGIVNADINSSAAIVDSKLAQITTASKVSGTAITGLASLPSGAGVIPIANIATGTPTGSKFVRDDGTLQVPSTDTNTSNVLFQYSASVEVNGTSIGELVSATISPNGGTGTYRFIMRKDAGNSTFTTVWITKWKKFSGVSTVTVYGQIWVDAGAGNKAMLKVDIGGANGQVSGTSGQFTPEWNSFTIDVSGLSNGTVYTVTVSTAHDANSTTSHFLGNLISFGS